MGRRKTTQGNGAPVADGAGVQGPDASTPPVAPPAAVQPPVDAPDTPPEQGSTTPPVQPNTILPPEDVDAALVEEPAAISSIVATLTDASRTASRAGDAQLHAYLEGVLIAAHALKLRLDEPRPAIGEALADVLNVLSTLL